MDDPLLAALEAGSPRAIPLLAERLERLAGVRHRMLLALAEMGDQVAMKRAAAAVLDALDTHLSTLQATLLQVQANHFDAATPGKIKATWDHLVALQRALGS